MLNYLAAQLRNAVLALYHLAMGTPTPSPEWERRLAEATSRDSDLAPGLVLKAIDKNGTLLFFRL